jgi:hypothetical protein
MNSLLLYLDQLRRYLAMLTIEKCFAVEGLLNEAKLEENYQKVLLEFIAGLKREVSIELEGRRRHWALRRQFHRKCK